MSNLNEGAKAARQTIKRFQEHLNSPNLVPDQCYRPASSTYSLVCVTNQITGLFLSKNYYIVPFFLRRAHEQLLQAKPERVSEPYRNLVEQYLCHVAHFTNDYRCLAEDEQHVADCIPQARLDITLNHYPMTCCAWLANFKTCCVVVGASGATGTSACASRV